MTEPTGPTWQLVTRADVERATKARAD